LPYLKGNFLGQRLVTSTIFAEFMNHIQEDKALLQDLVNSLLSSLMDESIKLQALRGLGNVASTGLTEVNRYAPTIIDALMCSIDDANEVIAMEAMNGLSKIFGLVDEARVAPILVNICHRIRPAFEKMNHQIRAVSFVLFGTLWRFGNGIAADAFYEQLHYNLPALILHMNDENDAVKVACKTSLRQLAVLFRAEELQNFFEGKALDTNRQLMFDEFLNELSKILINNFPDRINYYVMTSVDHFKSQWDTIKINAVAFVGVTLKNLPQHVRSRITLNPGLITDEMVKLLKDKTASVRSATGNAMSLLHSY